MSHLVLYDGSAGVANPGADADFLTTDVSLGGSRDGSLLRVCIATDGVDKVYIHDDTGTSLFLNKAEATVADAIQVFDIVASADRTYNVRSDGTDAATYLMVVEVWDE